MQHRNRSYGRVSVSDRRNTYAKGTDAELYERAKVAGGGWNLSGLREDAIAELERRFRVEHQIGLNEWASGKWDTLFVLTYPEIKISR